MKLDPVIPAWFERRIFEFCDRHELPGRFEDIVDDPRFWSDMGRAQGGEMAVEPVMTAGEAEPLARLAAERLGISYRIRSETYCGKPGAVRVEFFPI